MKKKTLIGFLVVAAVLLAVGGWMVDGGRTILRPRYA
jgi:hypothetical protein